LGDNEAAAGEIAVVRVLSGGLVVEVHDNRSIGGLVSACIVTKPTKLDDAAVDVGLSAAELNYLVKFVAEVDGLAMHHVLLEE